MSVTWRAEAAPAFPPSTAGCVCKRSLLWFVIISASLLISVGIISCLTVTFTDRQRAWVCVSADIIPSTASNHKRHASYLLRRLYQAVLGILLRAAVSHFPSFFSCVISRHLKPRLLYKCVQHSSIIHCFSLPDSCRFFFPPPFCGSWPISSVRAPDSEWNITVLFATAHPNRFL